ncbi:hypothetical protein [Paraburkholderia fungorum]|uniref:Uncharacterized protein n=1 Tax=Paraburkholderia fungorum TaxID=134537 RepID=A0AAW3UUY6_9BURK|nr:hypothetical protein [Paraburkholderia fungorum]MBB4519739.1 hypothetical protein [Paraburkholderia fungorum]MBB6201232.1 hypothetical protein [Paraburkholderia fungorum]
MDNSEIQIRDHSTETIERFAFPGTSRRGSCFLRFCVRNDTPIVLCAQLLRYVGTSVTNAAEEISAEFFRHLWNKKLFEIAVKKQLFECVLENRYEARVRDVVWQHFSKKVVWIEHYPPGAGLAPEGSYSLVGDVTSNPFWSYLPAERIVEEAGVTMDFLTVEPVHLEYERQT